MIDIKVRSKSSRPRCEFCRSELDEPEGLRCGHCRAWFHPGCVSGGRDVCPTPGCNRILNVSGPTPGRELDGAIEGDAVEVGSGSIARGLGWEGGMAFAGLVLILFGLRGGPEDRGPLLFLGLGVLVVCALSRAIAANERRERLRGLHTLEKGDKPDALVDRLVCLRGRPEPLGSLQDSAGGPPLLWRRTWQEEREKPGRKRMRRPVQGTVRERAVPFRVQGVEVPAMAPMPGQETNLETREIGTRLFERRQIFSAVEPVIVLGRLRRLEDRIMLQKDPELGRQLWSQRAGDPRRMAQSDFQFWCLVIAGLLTLALIALATG